MLSIHVSHPLKPARFAIGCIRAEPVLGKAFRYVGHPMAAAFGFKL